MIDSIPTNDELKSYRIKKYNRIEFKFKLIKLYKGAIVSKFVSIYTTGGITDCGNYFQLNSKQLVYSYRNDERLNDYSTGRKVKPYFSTSTCSQTKEWKTTKRRERKLLMQLSKIN